MAELCTLVPGATTLNRSWSLEWNSLIGSMRVETTTYSSDGGLGWVGGGCLEMKGLD